MSDMPLYQFRLFTAGSTPNSMQALANLSSFCRAHLAGRHEIDIVDVFDHPKRALSEGIFLTPTLVKLSPLPVQRFVGTLNQPEQLLAALGIEPARNEN